jgi:nicotinamide mononucleotide transporter
MNLFQELYEGILAMSWMEGFGVLFGLAYIFFAAKESIWCWPASLISVTLYIFICFQAKLYAETALQFYYLGTTLYGWYHWRNRKTNEDLPISTMKSSQHFLFIGIGAVLTIAVGYFLTSYTDASIPYIDSFTTVFSLLTTWLVTRKVLENWLYWIVVDSVGAYQYFHKELYLTSLLFAAYVVIVVFGYFKWLKIYKAKYA